MALAWFICTYNRRTPPPTPGRATRYCAMDDHTATIRADGGDWSESEVLGNYALVKVRAAAATLTTIGATAGFYRIPAAASLTTPLSTLTGGQRTALRARLEAMGYDTAEITASLGSNLALRTLGDVLRFAASLRRKPRYDAIADEIVMDGDIRTCKPIDDVDREIT